MAKDEGEQKELDGYVPQAPWNPATDPDVINIPEEVADLMSAPALIGQIPTTPADGYYLSRYLAPELNTTCKRLGMVPVMKGAKSKFTGELLIADEEKFPVDEEGRLLFGNMIIVAGLMTNYQKHQAYLATEIKQMTGKVNMEAPTLVK
jgi:hypothetical protein